MATPQHDAPLKTCFIEIPYFVRSFGFVGFAVSPDDSY
jgi:hypothetical protein